MHIIKIFGAALLVALTAGCAHPITVNPYIDTLVADSTIPPIKKNVGYFIAETTRTQEVTTPGGGGDKVSYQPYRDIETALYKMLTNVFANVTKLNVASGDPAVKKNNLDLIITPKLQTTSSSPSPLTWPPTVFSVALSMDITDAADQPITTLKVTGDGNAEFDEFKKDFSMSGKRASTDALLKMQKALLSAPELRK